MTTSSVNDIEVHLVDVSQTKEAQKSSWSPATKIHQIKSHLSEACSIPSSSTIDMLHNGCLLSDDTVLSRLLTSTNNEITLKYIVFSSTGGSFSHTANFGSNFHLLNDATRVRLHPLRREAFENIPHPEVLDVREDIRNPPQPEPQEEPPARIFQININLMSIAKFLFFVFIFSGDGNIWSIVTSAIVFFVFKLVLAYFGNRGQVDLNEDPAPNGEADSEPSPENVLPFDNQANWGIVEHLERFLFGLFASLIPSWNPRVVPPHEHEE